MIKYYSIGACNACRERSKLYQQVHDYMRRKKRLDFQVVPLTTTKALREYHQEVKPYREGRTSLPMVFDDEKKQELIFDEHGSIQPRRVVRAKKQAAEESAVSRRRPGNTEEAEPSDSKELAPES